MDRFSHEALNWDKNPDINRINENIANHVLPSILSPADSVLELGCGTGLLTFRAYKTVKEWYGVDTASGMIDMFNAKIPAECKTVKAETMFLQDPAQLSKKYSYGVSAMVFHHIPDMQSTISCLAQCVTKGLIIVDYQAWDGSIVFHPDDKMDGVERHGLDAHELIRMCKVAGFRDVQARVGFTLSLQRKGRDVEFPFLVIEARH